ncbi:CHAT domain-containing protein [Fusarium tricinctum]|uniref:CHAT domain-containing protein n=1 Tax=Fusarium tricinctum TaxID=61284 RepID=A0A8K0S3T2_9HYPO|nr:CHAT domain-containing protein [Fusarium tricinctum]
MSEDAEISSLGSIEDRITLARNALEVRSRDYPDFYSITALLANQLRKQHQSAESDEHLDALEESITLYREVLDNLSHNNASRPEWLIELAYSLNLRCDTTGSERDAIEASQLSFEAANAVQKHDPQYALILECACHFIGKKIIRLHDKDDAEDLFDMHVSILEVTPPDHPKFISRLRSYDSFLSKMYLAFGDIDALGEAIRASQHIVAISEQGSDEHARHLSILGERLVHRYLRTGTSADLDESIEACRQAVDETLADSPSRWRRMQALCDRLGEKYQQTTKEADYQAVKIVLDEILDRLPCKLKSRARSLGNIAIILSLRYGQTGKEHDFQRAVDTFQSSMALTAGGESRLAIRLSNLGAIYLQAYCNTTNMESLEKSISITREAIEATPENHPDRSQRCLNLAGGLRARYMELNLPQDLDEAISFYRPILYQSSASIFVRVHAGHSLMQCYTSKCNLNEAYQAASLSIIILSELIPRSLLNVDIQRELGKLSGLATEAASISLYSGHDPVVALELLETARGVMAASINVLRSDIQDLAKEFPELADRFSSLRDHLDSASTLSSQLLMGEKEWADQTSQRYNAGEDLSEVLTEIRSKPGFKWFMRPEDQERMKSAAALGPVIVVNVSQYSCHAIIIQQDQIRLVLLPSLNKRDIDLKYKSLGRGSLRVLEWLWETVAEPILDDLGFTEPPPEGNLKRVWWVLTDSLSTFPIHAAGRHTERNGETVMDRVMSSYATSVAAIVQSRRTRTAEHESTTNEALLVSAAETPGHFGLMFAEKEVRMLRHVCQSMNLEPIEPVPQRDIVLSHLRKCKIFHFAGHGHTDTADPSKSQLFLEDWQTHPLTISSLLELNLQREGPFLAYLSACGTGQIKSQRLFDEGIHLISACQLAGFRHVIGTLWEVNDESCVDMAAIIYDEIHKGGMSDDSVCRGVYAATKAKRDQWLQDIISSGKSVSVVASKNEDMTKNGGKLPRNVVACDDSDEEDFQVGSRNRPLHWVPYVHFGA